MRNAAWMIRMALFWAMLQPAAGGQQAKGTTPDSVALQFRWEPGLHATVVYQKSIIRDTAGACDTTRYQMAFRMSVEPHPDGMLIRRYDPFLVRVNGRALAGPESLAVMTTLGSMMTSIVVNNQGGFLDLHEKDSLVARVRRTLQRALRADDPRVVNFMKEETGKFLTQAAAEEWSAMVEFWAGSRLAVGVTDTLRWEAPTSLSAEVKFPMITLTMLQKGVDCSEYAPTASGPHDSLCVILSTSTRVEPDSLQPRLMAVLDRLAHRLGSPIPAARKDAMLLQMKGMMATRNTFLVTSPATLLPTLVVLQKITEVPEVRVRREESEAYSFQFETGKKP